MQNTYYKHPNISLDRKYVEIATGLTSYHYREFDNFKSKIEAVDIPEECTSLIKLRDTGKMHTTFTMITYDDEKLTKCRRKRSFESLSNVNCNNAHRTPQQPLFFQQSE